MIEFFVMPMWGTLLESPPAISTPDEQPAVQALPGVYLKLPVVNVPSGMPIPGTPDLFGLPSQKNAEMNKTFSILFSL
jgi:hypothetical protein